MKAKKVLAAGVLCALAIGLTACGGGSAVPGSPQDKKAKAGGTKTVMLYSSMQEDQLNAIKQAFEKKYPDIKMDYYFAGTGKVITKIATEAKSGQVAADVIWVGDPADYIGFKKLGILEKYESPEAKNIEKVFIDPEGYYTGARMMNMGIAYNTTKVTKEEAPKNWNDLLDPKWKGQIVMTDPG
ncbi:MAG: extracellular solute-binding protein, partial [Dialister invisus]